MDFVNLAVNFSKTKVMASNTYHLKLEGSKVTRNSTLSPCTISLALQVSAC
jgi:hypothetical protein